MADFFDVLEGIGDSAPRGWYSTAQLRDKFYPNVLQGTLYRRLTEAARQGKIETHLIGKTRYWPGPDAEPWRKGEK